MIVGVKKVDDGIVIYDNVGAGSIDIIFVQEGHPRWLEALTALEYAPTPVEPVIPVDTLKQKALDTIAVVLTNTRKRFITDLPGQDMIYLRKEQEAKTYLSLATAPATLVDFPFIAGEVGVTGQTAYEVAQVFSNLAALWLVIGSHLESIRIKYKTAVNTATTATQVNDALNNMNAELTALLIGTP